MGTAAALATLARRRRAPRLRMRALAPGEEHTVRAVFAGLSESSRARRFHGTVGDTLSEMVVRRLVDVGPHHRAIVAEYLDRDGWVPVGIARYAALGDGEAEIAVAVVDAWHGRGVGTRLLHELRERATRDGVGRLVAHVHADNAAALRIGRRAFPGARAVEGSDVVRHEVELGCDVGHLTVDELLADLLHR